MAVREAQTFCQMCTGFCGLSLKIDESDRIVEVRGDKSHPMSQGYACIKGLRSAHLYRGAQRILKPLKRASDGTYFEIPLAQALDEIAQKLNTIKGVHGPDSIGLYKGYFAFFNPLTSGSIQSFMQALGSSSIFSSATIDQSAKMVSAGRLGRWDAGKDHSHNADAVMVFGGNPLVSLGLLGWDTNNPVKRMKEFKKRGGKLIIIDPRRTETAEFADIFLQPLPGEDVSIAAGMLRIILAEGWNDHEFCARLVTQLAELRYAVDPFTPEYVAERAAIAPDLLRQAAKEFSQAKRGLAASGTGPNMAPRSNLAQHLIDCLDVVCGHFLREGDLVPNPDLFRVRPWRAEVVPPDRSWEQGPKSRVRGLGMLYGEKMTGALAQEITTAGHGQVRALIVDGGNPATSVPDQGRIVDALKSLELLVAIEPEFTSTARLAHYIIPPKLNFEQSNMPVVLNDPTAFAYRPFAQYAPPVIGTPDGSELIEDWLIFWSLAKRMQMPMIFDEVPLDMDSAPEAEQLFEILLRRGRVSFQDMKQYPGGHVFDINVYVEPALPGASAQFEVAPPDVVDELADVVDHYSARSDQGKFNLLLVGRRLRDVLNSAGRSDPVLRRRQPFNAAYLNPAELEKRGLRSGSKVWIVSSAGSIPAILRVDHALRAGVMSMTHGWGGLYGDDSHYEEHGSCTGALISSEEDCEKINAMPRMSAIPVYLTPF